MHDLDDLHGRRIMRLNPGLNARIEDHRQISKTIGRMRALL